MNVPGPPSGEGRSTSFGGDQSDEFTGGDMNRPSPPRGAGRSSSLRGDQSDTRCENVKTIKKKRYKPKASEKRIVPAELP